MIEPSRLRVLSSRFMSSGTSVIKGKGNMIGTSQSYSNATTISANRQSLLLDPWGTFTEQSNTPITHSLNEQVLSSSQPAVSSGYGLETSPSAFNAVNDYTSPGGFNANSTSPGGFNANDYRQNEFNQNGYPELANSQQSLHYGSVGSSSPAEFEVDPWNEAEFIKPPAAPPKLLKPIQPLSSLELIPKISFGTDLIQVDLCPEMSGLIFRFNNYMVSSRFHASSVTRRYSNFVWLFDALSIKYPFRMIPPLPPKRAVGVDAVFIEQRRMGLARFLNYIANHPVLRDEELVKAFLTVIDLQDYRNQHEIILEEEYSGKSLSEQDLAGIPQDIDERIQKAKESSCATLEIYKNMVQSIFSISKNLSVNSFGYEQFGASLSQLSGKEIAFKGKSAPFDQLIAGYQVMAQHIGELSETMSEHALEMATNTLERLKSQMELSHALQKLVAKRETLLNQMTIQQLEKRIQTNRAKQIELVQTGIEKEIEKLVSAIQQVNVLT